MNRFFKPGCLLFIVVAFAAPAQDARIHVQVDQALHTVSRYLTGACIEDVNHEVYGGIDSQMIFGESFAEPPSSPLLRGFTAYGGHWTPKGDELLALPGDGPKLLADIAPFSVGEVSVELFFTERTSGNAGLIMQVTDPRTGADRFNGYEVSLDAAGRLILGRHRQNWEPIRAVPCPVPLQQWIKLSARMNGPSLEVAVNDKPLISSKDTQHPLGPGKVGLRTWQREARFRNFVVSTAGATRKHDFALVEPDGWENGVSGMWRPLRRGTATGEFSLDPTNAFSGSRSQRLTFTSGSGEIGIENRSLNRWGMNVVARKSYEGFVCVRGPAGIGLSVALESGDGATVLAEKRLQLSGTNWQRLDFKLKPGASDSAGRFAIKLKHPGTVTVGYVFLQPGAWGRFKGLPVRRDIAEALIAQGITVLRQGGCMANASEYRWKKMIGPRETRPPYVGWWYPHSSNGWGIFDFLNFCQAAGFLAIPDVNMGESPQDMADFIDYVNGPVTSQWGRRRAADGHPKPYRLKYLQLGNEEQVNEQYWQKFKPLAEAIWAADPDIILVVGDFAYARPITDPFHFDGAAGKITSLAAHQKILQLARQHNREVWFDIHVGTEGPLPDFGGTFSYIDALARIADGARHRVVIFEFNAGNHAQRRALANALAVNAMERDGRIPIATSANCLQPDGQNDNDWDQGLLFLNPSRVWLQPPGYVTQMLSQDFQPNLVRCDVTAGASGLDVNAKRSSDGKVLTLQAVNPGDLPIATAIGLTGFTPKKSSAHLTELAAPINAKNTAAQPGHVVPQSRWWLHRVKAGETHYTFPPHSITILRFE